MADARGKRASLQTFFAVDISYTQTVLDIGNSQESIVPIIPYLPLDPCCRNVPI